MPEKNKNSVNVISRHTGNHNWVKFLIYKYIVSQKNQIESNGNKTHMFLNGIAEEENIYIYSNTSNENIIIIVLNEI